MWRLKGEPGTLSAYTGGLYIQRFARECGAKDPEVLTSTKLRKHIATLSQVLNLQANETDRLADFLGHDIRVHRQYYRLPQGTIQLAKMSKVLLAVENGTLSQYKGQALDNIEIDPEGMNMPILVQNIKPISWKTMANYFFSNLRCFWGCFAI